jgi:Cu(I)/Ag(I) efflux system membrane fusion protein
MKIAKKFIVLAVALVLAAVVGLVIFNPAQHHIATQVHAALYRCPMHPTYTSDKPGDCPICGMKLVKVEDKAQPAQSAKEPERAVEKNLGEICIERKCTMKNCPMMVKTHIKPGERIFCPICGEVMISTSGKAVEIHPAQENSAKKEPKLLYYRNPMDPKVTSKVAMKDQMGMDYVAVYEQEETSAAAGPHITITPEKRQLIGVEITPVKTVDLIKTVRASGKVAYDPELASTQEEFIQALNAKDQAKDSPLKDQIDRANELVSASRNKLKLLGMSDEQLVQLEKARQADTGLYLPGKGEEVWVYAAVYEYEISDIKEGLDADIEATAYPGEKFSGRVVSLNPVLDAMTRTNQVRIKVSNPESKLKPEMFVNASIKVDLGKKLAVPVAAVLDTGLRKIVYVSKENNVIESREVKLGAKTQDYYEVLDGLAEGESVVTSGNFLVDSESKLQNP